MSVEAVTKVWARSRRKGSELLLLLAIADYAHDDLTGSYPSVELLRKKTRMSERNVWLLLRKLQDAGEVVMRPGAGPHGETIYDIVLGETVVFKGRESRARSAKIAPERSAKIAPEECNPLQSRVQSSSVHLKEELRTVREPLGNREREIGNAGAAAPSLSQVPSPFVLGAAHYDFGAELGIPKDRVEIETRKFVAHHEMHRNRRRDWDAAWRKWMLDVPGFDRSRPAAKATNGSRAPSAASTVVGRADEATQRRLIGRD